MPTFRHGRNTSVLVNAYDLSEYFREASVSSSADTAETTAFKSATKTYVMGMTDGRVSLGGMFNGDVNGVDARMQAAFGQEAASVLTYAPEGLAVGRRVWGVAAHQSSYQVSGSVSDIVSVSAEFQASGGVRSGPSLADPAVPVTGTGMGTGVDGGDVVIGNPGGMGVLHVLSNTATGTFGVALQSSTAIGGTYTTFATFANIAAGTIGSLALFVPSGTVINKFVRASYTFGVAGGSVAAHVNFSRNVI